MKNIIFICHGNICRSPAAEFIAKHYLKTIHRENEFNIKSQAVSLEEIGNDIYPPMKHELRRQSIPFSYHSSSLITQRDYDWADIIFYMDASNLRRLSYYVKDTDDKFLPIFYYSDGIDEIEDPWYTDRYEKVINQITQCIKDIFKNI